MTKKQTIIEHALDVIKKYPSGFVMEEALSEHFPWKYVRSVLNNMGYRFCQKEKKYVHTDVITERKEKAIKLVKEKKVKVKEDNSFAMVQDDILNPLRAANKKLKQFGEILEKEPIRDGHCYNLYRDGKFVKSFYNYMEALRYAGIEFHGRRIDNYAKF